MKRPRGDGEREENGMAKQLENLRILIPGIETLEDLDEYIGSCELKVTIGGEPTPVVVNYTDESKNEFAAGIAPLGFLYLRENCFFRSYDLENLISDLIEHEGAM